MIFPSLTTLVLCLVILIALAVIDWYVWGITLARRYPLSPKQRRLIDEDTLRLRDVA